MSSNLPYFKFYPADFMGSGKVQMMSPTERGIYISLLCHEWQEGPLPDDPDRLARVSGASANEMDSAWPAVRRCFLKGDDGRLYHPRLERERDEAVARSHMARKAAKKRWANADAEASADADAQADADADAMRNGMPLSDAIPRVSESQSTDNSESHSTVHPTAHAKLVDYLPDNPGLEEAVESVAATSRNPGLWKKAVMGMYGPNGTEERLMAKVDEDERPKVLAVAIQRIASEGEKYTSNFFRAVVRKVIQERNEPDRRDFGDETERDIARRNEYRSRESERDRERWEEEDAEAEAKMAELWDWWEDQDEETRTRIELKAEKRCQGVPDHLRKPVLIGVIQEHRESEGDAYDSAGERG